MPSNVEIRPLTGDGWADSEPVQKAPAPNQWADSEPVGIDYGGLAKQAAIGVPKAIIGTAGMVGDIQQAAKSGADYLANKFTTPSEPDEQTRKYLEKYGNRGDLGPSFPLPTSADIQGQVEKVTGPFRKPQNQLEEDAQTATEFGTTALLGPGGWLRNLVTQGVIPAAATITAGRFSDQNPYVKGLAGFLAGAGGIGLSGPGSAEQLLRAKLPRNVTEADVNRAGQLIDHAQARGADLPWPEALSRVTGQPVLTDMMRYLESHPQTRGQTQEFFAARPQQLENAATAEFNRSFGPPTPNPQMIGPQAAEDATQTIKDVRAAINRATKPSYDAAAQTLVPQSVHARAMADPLFAEALHHVRNNPAISRLIGAQSDRSVEVYNEIKKYSEQRGRNLAQPTNPDASQQAAFSHNDLAAEVRDAALDADKAAGNYAHALAEQTRLREEWLNPLLHGPLGHIADSKETSAAIKALFPTGKELYVGGEHRIREAVQALVARRPAVAEQLVRQHLAMTFNEASASLQGGANQFGGAKFAKVLIGNPQKLANARAAVGALPNGAQRWRNVEGLLDIMAATGTRQPKGSLTEFNKLEEGFMTTGGLASLAAKSASPGLYMRAANKAFESWSRGRNLQEMTDILFNPANREAMLRIVRLPPGDERAVAAVGRLILLGGTATTEQRAKPN